MQLESWLRNGSDISGVQHVLVWRCRNFFCVVQKRCPNFGPILFNITHIRKPTQKVIRDFWNQESEVQKCRSFLIVFWQPFLESRISFCKKQIGEPIGMSEPFRCRTKNNFWKTDLVCKKDSWKVTQEGLRHLWGSACAGLKMLEPFLCRPKTIPKLLVDFVSQKRQLEHRSKK